MRCISLASAKLNTQDGKLWVWNWKSVQVDWRPIFIIVLNDRKPLPMCNLSLNWSVQIRSTDQSLRARGLEKVFHFSPRMLQKHAALWQTSFQLIFNFAENSAADFNFHTNGESMLCENLTLSRSHHHKLTSLLFRSLSEDQIVFFLPCPKIWLMLLSFIWCDSGC